MKTHRQFIVPQVIVLVSPLPFIFSLVFVPKLTSESMETFALLRNGKYRSVLNSADWLPWTKLFEGDHSSSGPQLSLLCLPMICTHINMCTKPNYLCCSVTPFLTSTYLLRMYLCGHLDHAAHGSPELLFSFHHTGPGNWTQVLRLVAGTFPCSAISQAL